MDAIDRAYESIQMDRTPHPLGIKSPTTIDFRDGAEWALGAAVAALWERIEREEYGHAKAAVALDIEAIKAIAATPEEEPAP